MVNLVPIEYYAQVWYLILLIIVCKAILQLRTQENVLIFLRGKNYSSRYLLAFTILYIGLRPVSEIFVDMGTYGSIFKAYASGDIMDLLDYDILWQLFVKTCSRLMSVSQFFLLCTVIYVIPLFIASNKWLGGNGYFLFLMFVASFSFWSYGTNGIRNGIATSIFVLAVSYSDKNYFKYVLLAFSYYIHGSLIIPIAAFVIASFYTNTKTYFFVWLISIPLSLSLGNSIEIFFSSIGFGDDRLTYLTEVNDDPNAFAYTGFRWDFILYSFSAISVGYFFIQRRMFSDKIYTQIVNIYLIVNAFWILIIRANYSNRFAYLSWFLMAIVIFYPFLKIRVIKSQQKILAHIMLCYFGFTYLMFLLK